MLGDPKLEPDELSSYPSTVASSMSFEATRGEGSFSSSKISRELTPLMGAIPSPAGPKTTVPEASLMRKPVLDGEIRNELRLVPEMTPVVPR